MPSFDDLLTCPALQYGVDHTFVMKPLVSWEGRDVLDLFFLILTVVFFAGCLAYILGCERL